MNVITLDFGQGSSVQQRPSQSYPGAHSVAATAVGRKLLFESAVNSPSDCVRGRSTRPRLTPTQGIAMPRVTDLRMVLGRRLLIVADCDNWDYSLKRCGLRLRYAALLDRLSAKAKQVFAVAVLASAPGDCRRAEHLTNCGWEVVSIAWETVTTYQGVRKLANADMDLAFECGSLSVMCGCDVALIGTGDGDLAVCIARGLRRIRHLTPIAIHTLSIAGASSSRLRQRSDLLDSSLIIGQDMLEKIDPRQKVNKPQCS